MGELRGKSTRRWSFREMVALKALRTGLALGSYLLFHLTMSAAPATVAAVVLWLSWDI